MFACAQAAPPCIDAACELMSPAFIGSVMCHDTVNTSLVAALGGLEACLSAFLRPDGAGLWDSSPLAEPCDTREPHTEETPAFNTEAFMNLPPAARRAALYAAELASMHGVDQAAVLECAAKYGLGGQERLKEALSKLDASSCCDAAKLTVKYAFVHSPVRAPAMPSAARSRYTQLLGTHRHREASPKSCLF